MNLYNLIVAMALIILVVVGIVYGIAGIVVSLVLFYLAVLAWHFISRKQETKGGLI